MNEFQQYLKDLVTQSGLTQREFSAATKVPQATLNQNMNRPRSYPHSIAFYQDVLHRWNAHKSGTVAAKFLAERKESVTASLSAKFVDKTPPLKAALWVGGPPGRTLDKIRRRLRMDGIDLRAQSDHARKPPVWADIVLVNREMVGHSDSDKQRSLCEADGVPCVIVSTSYTFTRRALENRSFVEPTTPRVELESALDDDDDDDESAGRTRQSCDYDEGEYTNQENFPMSISSKDDLETQKEQLRRFLLSLPPELRQVAVATNTELKIAEEDEAFDKVFAGLPEALEAVNDEALIRGLGRVFPKNVRDRLGAALGLVG